MQLSSNDFSLLQIVQLFSCVELSNNYAHIKWIVNVTIALVVQIQLLQLVDNSLKTFFPLGNARSKLSKPKHAPPATWTWEIDFQLGVDGVRALNRIALDLCTHHAGNVMLQFEHLQWKHLSWLVEAKIGGKSKIAGEKKKGTDRQRWMERNCWRKQTMKRYILLMERWNMETRMSCCSVHCSSRSNEARGQSCSASSTQFIAQQKTLNFHNSKCN